MSGIIGKNASRSSGVIGTSAAGIASLAADSSPQLGGFLDANGNYIQMQKGGDISSASPTVIDTDGDYFDVTGTTNFAAFTVAADRHFFIQFDGALTMTHHATNLDLPGAANITTAAGDVAEFFATGTNTVQCVNYTKADGTAVVAGASGDLRNFILDGDFTQWPEGTSQTGISNGDYISALWEYQHSASDAVYDGKQSTDVPTVAQSSHQSAYSLDLDCTTLNSTAASGDIDGIKLFITGSDFTHLHQQEVTLAFWIKATITGTSGGSFTNSASDRSYPFSFTISSADTWEYKTVTLEMDTSGTWLFTEADIGVRLHFCLAGGSTRLASAGSWGAGNIFGPTGQVNHCSSTSNIYRLAQVGLYLGSTAPTFTSPPIATVKSQVDYYVQRYNYDTIANETVAWSAYVSTTAKIYAIGPWREPLRVTPTVTNSAGATFRGVNGDGASDGDSAFTVDQLNKWTFRIGLTTTATPWVVSESAMIQRDSSDTTFIMADSRH